MSFCEYYVDGLQRSCNSTYLLYHVYFRNPENAAESREVAMCKYHFNEVINDLYVEIRKLEMIISSAWYNFKLDRKTAKENDAFFDYDVRKNKIDDLTAARDAMKNDQCMNNLCKRKLKEVIGKIYTAQQYYKGGYFGKKLNFCSRPCWLKIMARCGVRIKFHAGPKPLTLENYWSEN